MYSNIHCFIQSLKMSHASTCGILNGNYVWLNIIINLESLKCEKKIMISAFIASVKGVILDQALKYPNSFQLPYQKPHKLGLL